MRTYIRNNLKILKSIYGAVIGVAYQLSFQLSQSVGVQIWLIFLTVTLYALPMLANIEIIKRYETDGIKKFILSDLLFLFSPAIITSVLTELVYGALSSVPDYTNGMGSAIFLCVTVLLTPSFWLIYLIVNTVYSRKN